MSAKLSNARSYPVLLIRSLFSSALSSFVRKVDIKILVCKPVLGAVINEVSELSGPIGNAVCVEFPRVFLGGDGEFLCGECSVRDQ